MKRINKVITLSPNMRLLLVVGVYACSVIVMLFAQSVVIMSVSYALPLSLLVVLAPSTFIAFLMVVLSIIIGVWIFIFSGDKPKQWVSMASTTIIVVVFYAAMFLIGNSLGGVSQTFYYLLPPLVIFVALFSSLIVAPRDHGIRTAYRALLGLGLSLAVAITSFYSSMNDQLLHNKEQKKLESITTLSECRQLEYNDTWKSCVEKNFHSSRDYSICISTSTGNSSLCNSLRDRFIVQEATSISDCNKIKYDQFRNCVIRFFRQSSDLEACLAAAKYDTIYNWTDHENVCRDLAQQFTMMQ